MIPVVILEVSLSLALLGNMAMFFVHNNENYLGEISGLASILFWFASAYMFLIGVVSDGMLFTSSALFFIFLVIGIIVAIIDIVKIIDTIKSENKDHIGDMSI